MSRFGARLRGAQAVSTWLRGGGGGGLRSIQRGTITIVGGGVLSNTATITAVDTANTVLVMLGQSSNSSASDIRDSFARITLTNATTVTANRTSGVDAAASITVSFEVREYFPGVYRSIQRATITNSGGTATINAVDTSKSEVTLLGHSSGASSSIDGILQSLPRIALTNATTVTATSGSQNFVASVQVAERY